MAKLVCTLLWGNCKIVHCVHSAEDLSEWVNKDDMHCDDLIAEWENRKKEAVVAQARIRRRSLNSTQRASRKSVLKRRRSGSVSNKRAEPTPKKSRGKDSKSHSSEITDGNRHSTQWNLKKATSDLTTLTCKSEDLGDHEETSHDKLLKESTSVHSALITNIISWTLRCSFKIQIGIRKEST